MLNRQRFKRLLSFCLAGLLLVVIAAGCGQDDGLDRVEVSGTVKVNGKPLEDGRIAFMPIESTPGPATGAPIKEGEFTIPKEQGPTLGNHRIEIVATRPSGKKVSEGSGSESPDQLVNEIEQYIPEKYNRKSELTANVTPESAGKLSFDLKIPQ